MITSQNVFAALDTKKKKKSSKSKDADEKKKKKEASKADRSAELERAIFSGPKVSISNWADTDDDDDFADELPESWSAPVRPSHAGLQFVGACTCSPEMRINHQKLGSCHILDICSSSIPSSRPLALATV